MKVLHTISTLGVNGGGPSTCTYTLVKGLNEAGIDVNILTFSPEEGDVLISREKFIHLIDRPRETRFGFSKLFRSTLEDYPSIDLIHANCLWQYVSHVSGIKAREKKIPFVLSPHGMLYPSAMDKSKWIKKISLYLYQFSDLQKASTIHATCIQEKDYIRAIGIKAPIAVIPNPIKIPENQTKVVPPEGKKRVGFLGLFSPIKNIEFLIKAWSITGKKNSDWELVLIGDGSTEYKVSLFKLASDLGITNILFPGFLSGDAKEDMMNSLSYLVLPSKSENFGMVVAEALIKDIPVIASKGTPWEELNVKYAGWWIDIGVDPLVKALREAMELSDLERKKMGENGRKLVEENYSIEIVSKKMIELYGWILGKKDKPSFVFLE